MCLRDRSVLVWASVFVSASVSVPASVSTFASVPVPCILFTSPSPRDSGEPRMPSSA